MEATEILMEEHRVIERVLDAMETAADRLDRGEAVPARFFTDSADFVAGFADGCHHRKEEDVLFPAMAAAGIPTESGPLGVMLDEHEQGRVFIRGLRGAALAMAAGEPATRAVLVAHARGYVALLRAHIAKEDNILFPMADRSIAPGEQARVAADFEHIEHEETGAGVHERYLGLADRLVAEAGGR